MRWHNQLLIAMAVFGAVAATAGAAWGATGSSAAGPQVKGKVDNGTLTITGTSAAETLSLMLAPGDPTTLDVVDGSGSVVFAFDRSTFDKIVVNAGGDDDTVRIDQFGGTFTDTEATTLNGQGGDDTSSEAPSPKPSTGAPGTTSSTATSAPTALIAAPATTRSSGIRATAATRSRKGGKDTLRSTAPTPARRSTSPPTARACA